MLMFIVNGGSPVTLDDVVKTTAACPSTDVEDHLVMETKLAIIEILKVLRLTVHLIFGCFLLSYVKMFIAYCLIELCGDVPKTRTCLL